MASYHTCTFFWVSVPLPDDQTQEGVLHGNWRRGSTSQDEPAAGTQIPLSAGSRGADQEGPGEGRGAADGETIWLQLYHARWEESQPLWVSVDLTLTVSGQVRGVPSSCVRLSVVVEELPMDKWFDSSCIMPGERGPASLDQWLLRQYQCSNNLMPTVSHQVRGVPASLGQCM